jgi:hypothetical protein
MEGVQTFVHFDLKELKECVGDDKRLRGIIRSKLCEMAEICFLEPAFVLPFVPEVMEKIKEEIVKFKFGPKEHYPIIQHNVLKLQLTMPTAGKVGHLFWAAKVVV